MAYGRWKSLDHVERYAQKRYKHWDQRMIDRREQSLVKALLTDHRISGALLDVPVGYGRFQRLLKDFGAVYAGDWGYFPALYAHSRLGIADLSINCDAQQLPFVDGSMDLVFCFRLMQHMHKREERIKIYREFARVSHAWVIVSVYLESRFHAVHRKLFTPPSRITLLPQEQFDEETREAGLIPVEQRSVIPGLHAHRIALFRVS
ncbi:MAG: class I SAM-dependent methyltransferase [Fidelibacterota bacterium]